MNTTFNAARNNNPKFELLKPALPSLEDKGISTTTH